MARSYEDRVNELEEKIQQMQNLKKELQQRQKAEDRKARTHRLIQLGAELENAAGYEIDPEVLAVYLKTVVKRDDAGGEVTVAEMQKHYYERTARRLEEQREKSAEEIVPDAGVESSGG